jgi:hypothetical protein
LLVAGVAAAVVESVSEVEVLGECTSVSEGNQFIRSRRRLLMSRTLGLATATATTSR